jgi:hypothetical protein
MSGRVVHIECGKPPSACDCPASIRRPLRCVIQQLDRIDRELAESMRRFDEARGVSS